jgi:hypothetical protein
MKITKSKLKQIIKEELRRVLKESAYDRFALGAGSNMAAMSKARDQTLADERAQRPQYTPQQASEVYELHWEEAVREIINPRYDEEYDDYNPQNKDPEARSNVTYALNHLQILLRKNSSPSTQEIIEAIDDGWDESSYEFQYQQEREYEDEDY